MNYHNIKLTLSLYVHDLKHEITTESKPVIYRESLIAELGRLEAVLASDRPNPEDLKSEAYAIFRTVTDDWGLASSSFGQRLLEVGRRLEELAKAIPY